MFPIRDNIRSRRTPFVNYAIIIINVVVFVNEVRLAQNGLLSGFIDSFGFTPARFLDQPASAFSTFFTSMFLHGSWGHLIGNIWYLYVFGDNVEDNLGHLRYVVYYLLMGVGAASFQMAANPSSTVPMVGASGAIAGVLGGYFVLYPGARVLSLFVFVIFIRVIEVPAFFFLGFWFLTQAVNGIGALASVRTTGGETGGIAWWAHAGGFLAGFLAIPFFRERRRRRG